MFYADRKSLVILCKCVYVYTLESLRYRQCIISMLNLRVLFVFFEGTYFLSLVLFILIFYCRVLVLLLFLIIFNCRVLRVIIVLVYLPITCWPCKFERLHQSLLPNLPRLRLKMSECFHSFLSILRLTAVCGELSRLSIHLPPNDVLIRIFLGLVLLDSRIFSLEFLF